MSSPLVVSQPISLAFPARSSIVTRAMGWLLIVATIFLLALAQTIAIDKVGELGVYLKAAARMATGDPLYLTNDGPAFSYPPFFAIVFIPLTWLPKFWADVTWNAINLGLLVGIVGSLRATFDRLRIPSTWWSVTVIVVLAGRFLVSPLEYRSHDLIIFALLVAGLRASLEGCERSLGLWCGLAAACKATPLLVLPWLLVQRRWLAAITFTLAMIVATLLPDLITPAKSCRLWVEQWYSVFVSKVETTGPADAPGAWRAWNPLNQGLAGTLYRLTSPPVEEEFRTLAVNPINASPGARRLLTLAALGGIFLTTVASGWLLARNVRQADDATKTSYELAAWGMLVAAMLLLSPMSSKQHFCTLLIPITHVCLLASQPPTRRTLYLCGLAIIFLCGTCLVKDLVGRPLGNLALAAGSLTWCAAACWVTSLGTLVRRQMTNDQAPMTKGSRFEAD